MTRPLLTIAGSTGLWAAAVYAQIVPAALGFQGHDWMASNGAATMRIEGEQSGSVVGRPFSAVEVRRTVQTLSDGSHIDHSDTSHFYRDSQGRMREESPDRVEIFDPVSNYEYDLNPKSKTYNRILHSGDHLTLTVGVIGSLSHTAFHSGNGTVERNSSSGAKEELAPQIFNGLSAKGTRVTVTIPAGTFGNDRDLKVVNERWYSDDLDALVRSSNSDPRFGATTYDLTNIQRVPPDALLFQVPPGYTLREDRKQ